MRSVGVRRGSNIGIYGIQSNADISHAQYNNRTATDTASSDGFFSMNRLVSRRSTPVISDQTNLQKNPVYRTYSDQSQRISRLASNAVGKTLNKTNYSDGSATNINGFSYGNTSLVTRTLQRARSSGAVAPKKKGAIANPYKSGGSSLIGGSYNRQLPIGPINPLPFTHSPYHSINPI